ncbi:MAG TPA: hypothetical protein VHX59_26955 [Mycobacteriales bacterium]|nr:hypothetical protein [Mycobacteriales bacterium]
MTSNETILELLQRHVTQDGEQTVRVKHWPDGVALTTNLRHFVAGPEPADWSVSAEQWADDVVIAIRDDIIIEGEPERFGFLLLAGGGDVYLNDRAAVAELGRRLADGMNPLAYAEILVGFHPYSSATRAVVPEPDGLRRAFDRNDLPDVAALQLRQEPEGATLTFSSYARYSRTPAGAPLLDLTEWTVTVPFGEQAQWEARRTVEGIRL